MTAPTRDASRRAQQQTDPLHPHHRRTLEVESVIDPQLITERGYHTITKKIEAKRLGFSATQQDTISPENPALIIPMRWLSSVSSFSIMRPDQPRIKGYKQDGMPKLVKYEMPTGVKMALDSPRRCHADLGNPNVPLMLTEGQKKADSGASRGGCWLSLVGVWNFRGAGEHGGKTMLRHWEDVALDGRKVYMVFDSDILEKIEVHNALGRLRDALKQRGADVYVIYLPAMPDGSKCGVDDWFAADSSRTLSDLLQLASKDLIKPAINVRREVYTTVADALPDAPVADDIVVPLGYELGAGGVAKIEQDRRSEDSLAERRTPVALAPLYIAGRLTEAVTGAQSLVIRYRQGATGEWRMRIVDRDVAMDARKLTHESKHGVPVTSGKAGALVDYLEAMEAANIDHLPTARTSTTMGWQGKGGADGFLLGRTHVRPGSATATSSVEDTAPEEWAADGITYRAEEGAEQLADAYHARGTYEAWLDAIAVVPRYPRVMLALYAAFAAPILEIVGAPNCVIDWSYETSAGKTTALRLAGSIWGNPDEQDAASVIKTWRSTRVWIERTAEAQPGLPLLLDETKRARADDVAGIVYDYANGQGRGRGTIRGIARSGAWRGVLLSTGEQPVTTIGENEHGGVHARAIEIWGSPFGTKDPQTGRVVSALNLALRANYGHAGLHYVQHLVDHRDAKAEAWRARYQETLATYQRRAGGDAVAARLCEYLAAIDTAARIVHEAGILHWDYADPVDVLWADIMGGAGSADKATAARDYIYEWAVAHQAHFFGRHRLDAAGDPVPPHSGWAGVWKPGEDYEYVAILPHVVDRLLSERKYGVDVKRQWADRGWTAPGSQEKPNRVRLRIAGKLEYLIGLRRAAHDSAPDDDAYPASEAASHA